MALSGIQILNETITAAGTIGKNRFIGFDGNYPTAAGSAFGIVHFDALSSDPVAVTTLGVYPVYAAGAIAVGAEVEMASDGKVLTKTAGVTVGRARQESTGDGDLIEVFIIPS